MTQHTFGGHWTEIKLEKVSKYLAAYTNALKNQRFQKIYIDAFAGTGYRTPKSKNKVDGAIQTTMDETAHQQFLHGSASNALEINPPFDKFIFIEKSKEYFQELENLKTKYPQLAPKMQFIQGDANNNINEFCKTMQWSDRAVMFLDPYGMEIHWSTIEIIAATKKIDLWYLFPLGMGLNRLLRKDGSKIGEVEEGKLNTLLGTTDWQNAFYTTSQQLNLFDTEEAKIEKTADTKKLQDFVVKRLQDVFGSGVATNPLILKNSKEAPLYLLCFAASNQNGARIALKIANHILTR